MYIREEKKKFRNCVDYSVGVQARLFTTWQFRSIKEFMQEMFSSFLFSVISRDSLLFFFHQAR